LSLLTCARHEEEFRRLFDRRTEGVLIVELDEPVDWPAARDRDAVLEWVIDHARAKAFVASGVVPIVAKPFVPDELHAAIAMTPGVREP
jgi:hypothetical protein